MKTQPWLRSFLYGMLYKNEKKYLEAAEYFKSSMNQGNSDALYEYAELVRKGRLQTESPEKSYNYYKEAIKSNNLKAIYKYAILLLRKKRRK